MGPPLFDVLSHAAVDDPGLYCMMIKCETEMITCTMDPTCGVELMDSFEPDSFDPKVDPTGGAMFMSLEGCVAKAGCFDDDGPPMSGSGSGFGSGPPGPPEGPPPTCSEIIASADLNGDGKLVLAEWTADPNCHSQEEFEEYDEATGNDGELDEDDCLALAAEVVADLGEAAANPAASGPVGAEA